MQETNVPPKFSIPWANSGTKNAIPTASQIGITPGAASLTDGFPPLTFTPIAAGGVPPAGADFNGILNMLSAAVQWSNAGGLYSYDAAFSTAIGGYPNGAVLVKADFSGFWISQVDNNASDPDTGGANWLDMVRSQISNYQANLLPNTQWQVITGIQIDSKMLADGTGVMPPITVTGYTTGNNTITATTGGASTGELKVDDLVIFSAAADTNLKICSMIVDSITPNVSFTGTLPMGFTAAASAACTAQPSASGGPNTSPGSGAGPDGWNKTTTLIFWREDNAINTQPGSKYSLGIKKGVATSETMNVTVTGSDIFKYRGRTIVFGTWVMQKIRGGAGSWNAFITSDGTGGATVSSPSSSAAIGIFDWQEISYTIPVDATTLTVGINTSGALNDVYYTSQPMAAFGNSLGRGNYAPMPSERLIPTVKMSPLSWINAAPVFPTVIDGVGTYSFAFKPYPETNGAIAPTVKQLYMQIEGYNASALIIGGNPHLIAFRDTLAPPIKYAIILGQYGVSIKSFADGLLTLDGNGNAVAYSVVSGDTWANVSIDISSYFLN